MNERARLCLARALRAIERARLHLAAGRHELAAERACRGSLWALRAVLAQRGLRARSRRELLAAMEKPWPANAPAAELDEWFRFCAAAGGNDAAPGDWAPDDAAAFVARGATAVSWACAALGFRPPAETAPGSGGRKRSREKEEEQG